MSAERLISSMCDHHVTAWLFTLWDQLVARERTAQHTLCAGVKLSKNVRKTFQSVQSFGKTCDSFGNIFILLHLSILFVVISRVDGLIVILTFHLLNYINPMLFVLL